MNSNEYIQIFQNFPIAVIVVDLHGLIRTMNRLASRMLNLDADAINKKHLHTVLENQCNGKIRELLTTSNHHTSGSCKLHMYGRIQEMTSSCLIDDKGINSGTLFLFQDITERETIREKETTEAKYAVMGELSADIAHEIRNPLGSIELLASLLRKELKRKKDINRAEQIMAAVRNMENKISSLIQFSKTYQAPVGYVNLHDLLKNILHFSEKNTDRELPFISAQYADIEPFVECNPDMMKQIFLTLILNILQSLPDTSRLDIMTHYFQEPPVIEIHFIEKGLGTQETIHSNMLDRFSHNSDNQWGLGLAIIHNIINMYSGSLRLEYLQTVGTAFVLAFPLADRTKDPAARCYGTSERETGR